MHCGSYRFLKYAAWLNIFSLCISILIQVFWQDFTVPGRGLQCVLRLDFPGLSGGHSIGLHLPPRNVVVITLLPLQDLPARTLTAVTHADSTSGGTPFFVLPLPSSELASSIRVPDVNCGWLCQSPVLEAVKRLKT